MFNNHSSVSHSADDFDNTVQSDFHRFEAQALLNGEIRRADFVGVSVAFETMFDRADAH